MSSDQHLGTCVLLINDHQQVLLGKRKNSYLAGTYGLPGGRVEINEPLEAAARREVREETGLTMGELRFLGVIRENQGEYDFIHFAYTAEVGAATPMLCEPDKCEGWEWYGLQELPTDILPGHFQAITLLRVEVHVIDKTTLENQH